MNNNSNKPWMRVYVEVGTHPGIVVSALSSHCTHPNPLASRAAPNTHPSRTQPVIYEQQEVQ